MMSFDEILVNINHKYIQVFLALKKKSRTAVEKFIRKSLHTIAPPRSISDKEPTETALEKQILRYTEEIIHVSR